MQSRPLYWITTLLFSVLVGISGIGYLANLPAIAQLVASLGYPLYVMPFIGIAKVVGVAVILIGKWRTLKEWAYGCFTILLLLAAYSHLRSSQFALAIAPLATLAMLLISYREWKR